MRARSNRSVVAVFVSVSTMGLGLVGCRNEAPPPAPVAVTAPTVVAAPAAAAPRVTAVDPTWFDKEAPARDPFAAYLHTSPVDRPPTPVRGRPPFAVDSLRLVGIVGAGGERSAMFVDPTGKGWTFKRGESIGNGEAVAGLAYPLQWKVDRIKDDVVVLIREDTMHEELVPTYREVALHPERDKEG